MKKIVVIITFVLALMPLIVYAQSDLQSQTEAFAGEQGAGFVGANGVPQDPRYVFGLILRVAVSLLGIGMVAYLVYGGYLIFTSAGEEERMKKGKKTIVTALIGAALILSAYAITRYVFLIGRYTRSQEDVSVPTNVPGEPSGRPAFCWWIFCGEE